MSLTSEIRERVKAASGVCPCCGQPTRDGGVRSLATEIGVPHTVLWRFLKGGDATGRTLDAIAAWLDADPRPA